MSQLSIFGGPHYSPSALRYASTSGPNAGVQMTSFAKWPERATGTDVATSLHEQGSWPKFAWDNYIASDTFKSKTRQAIEEILLKDPDLRRAYNAMEQDLINNVTPHPDVLRALEILNRIHGELYTYEDLRLLYLRNPQFVLTRAQSLLRDETENLQTTDILAKWKAIDVIGILYLTLAAVGAGAVGYTNVMESRILHTKGFWVNALSQASFRPHNEANSDAYKRLITKILTTPEFDYDSISKFALKSGLWQSLLFAPSFFLNATPIRPVYFANPANPVLVFHFPNETQVFEVNLSRILVSDELEAAQRGGYMDISLPYPAALLYDQPGRHIIRVSKKKRRYLRQSLSSLERA